MILFIILYRHFNSSALILSIQHGLFNFCNVMFVAFCDNITAPSISHYTLLPPDIEHFIRLHTYLHVCACTPYIYISATSIYNYIYVYTKLYICNYIYKHTNINVKHTNVNS